MPVAGQGAGGGAAGTPACGVPEAIVVDGCRKTKDKPRPKGWALASVAATLHVVFITVSAQMNRFGQTTCPQYLVGSRFSLLI